MNDEQAERASEMTRELATTLTAMIDERIKTLQLDEAEARAMQLTIIGIVAGRWLGELARATDDPVAHIMEAVPILIQSTVEAALLINGIAADAEVVRLSLGPGAGPSKKPH